MKKMDLVMALSFAVASNGFAATYYVEPMIGSHHKVDEDSQKQKSEIMGGLRLGTELSNRLDLELGAMTGKAKGKNGYESKRENLGTLGVAYNLVDNKTGFIPYVTGAVGTLDGINSTVLGIGAKYGFTNGTALRFDVRDFIQNGDHDLVSTVGYVIPFGKKEQPVAAAIAAPVVVASALMAEQPKKEEVAKVAAPMAVEKASTLQEKTFETIVYFDFDKDLIKASEAKKLSEFAENAKKANELNVSLAGFTDVLGSESYNQKLSQKRANVVKSFLENKGLNVTIQADGKGVKGIEKSKTKRAQNRVVIVKGTGKVSQ
jgi:outer membrane protein OmpA-like peptidoglycan-associated protein